MSTIQKATASLACLMATLAAAPVAAETNFAQEIVSASNVNTGLCIQLDVADGQLAVDLANAGEFLVHGIALSRNAAESARQYIATANLHGTVSVEQGSLTELPYVDNLVNLIVVDDYAAAIGNGLSLGEVMRVLCPGGIAYLGQLQADQDMPDTSELNAALIAAGVTNFEIVSGDANSVMIRETRPPEIDEWTHWLHGPETNNSSSDTLAGPPLRPQWIDGPIWLISPNVTELFANGRSFNVSLGTGGSVSMTVRDAFNGLELWRCELGESDPRLILAVGDRVYAVATSGGPLVALDAATGLETQTYDVGFSPLCVLYKDGNLILGSNQAICSVNADTGVINWQKTPPANTNFILENPGPLPPVIYKSPYMVIGSGQLFVMVKDGSPPYSLVSYDLTTGQQNLNQTQPGELLAHYQGVVLLYEVISTTKPVNEPDENGIYHAVSPSSGSTLWTRADSRAGYHAAWDDLAYAGGLIWLNDDSGNYIGLDPATGNQTGSQNYTPRGHCGRIVGTPNYLIATMSDFEVLATGGLKRPQFYKNGCIVGQLPANGLIYSFPISCSCIAYTRGNVAFSPTRAGEPDEIPPATTDPLEEGPAYGILQPPGSDPPVEWNTYRHDIQRSGASHEGLFGNLEMLWSTSVTDHEQTYYGRTMSPPVVAEGKVFVAAVDDQEVIALDAQTGHESWRYRCGGRVEVPPTIYGGLCLFGANDGYVYCLQASDGQLVWRFRAAWAEKRIVAYGRVESLWPVPGVLVSDGVAYFAAGRHGRTIDGISVYAINPFTGAVIWTNRVNNQNTETWYDNHVNDLLVADDEAIFMGQLKFDADTGARSRTWYKDPNVLAPLEWTDDYLLSGQGRDTTSLFPFGFLHDRRNHGSERYDSTKWFYKDVTGMLLTFQDGVIFSTTDQNVSANAGGSWSKSMPASVQAMLPAGQTLVVAGSNNENSGVLGIYSSADGNTLSEFPLSDAPVFDGLAATDGQICVSTQSGKVLCFGTNNDFFILTVISGAGSGSYTSSQVVAITADPAPTGEIFDAWTGDTATVADTSAASTTITINAEATVTATYRTALPCTLTVNSGGGSGSYIEGQVVAITADPAPTNEMFDAWTGDITTVANTSTASTTITMNADATVTATYRLAPLPGSGRLNIQDTQIRVDHASIYSNVWANICEATAGSYFTLSQFDISDLSGTVASVTLDIIARDIEGLGNPHDITVYPLVQADEDWVDGQASGTQKATGVSWVGGSRPYDGSVSSSATWTPSSAGVREAFVMDVTAVLQKMVDNGQVTGTFYLTSPTTPGWTGKIIMGQKEMMWDRPGGDPYYFYDYQLLTVGLLPENYYLTVINGTGSDSCTAGEVVAISADAAPSEQVFNEWTGDTTGVADVDASSTTITMPASDATVTATYKYAGDLNEDGQIDVYDLNMILIDWGKSAPNLTDPRADVDGDGTVTVYDLNYVLIDWDKTGPQP